MLGVNFPLLSLYEHLRMPVELAPNDIDVRLDRALVNRYAHDLDYRHVYVDLDDTLLVGDAVNARLVAFVYQCVNAGRRVVLITAMSQDVDQTLDRFRLSALWDEVIHIEDASSRRPTTSGSPTRS